MLNREESLKNFKNKVYEEFGFVIDFISEQEWTDLSIIKNLPDEFKHEQPRHKEFIAFTDGYFAAHDSIYAEELHNKANKSYPFDKGVLWLNMIDHIKDKNA